METVILDFKQVVHANAAVTSSGSAVFTGFGAKEINLIINITGPVTGGSPTLQYTITEVDPGDLTTQIGLSRTGAALTAVGVQTVSLPITTGGTIKVSWAIGGSSPSFGGVYATLTSKIAGASTLYDAVGNAVFGAAGTPGVAVLTVQGAPGGEPSPVSGTVTGNQGTAAALSGAWPTKVTDGTNTLPTADAAARALYARLTDGTSTIGVLAKTLYSDPNGDRRTVHNNATLTTSGSQVLTWIGYAEWYLIINLKNAPTGTAPTIQFKIEQLDPIDQTTVLTGVKSWTGTLKTAAGVDVIEIPEFVSDTIKISWTITGTTPSWTGVNVSFCGHASGNAIEGQAEVGTLAEDPPVPVAGADDTGAIQYIRIDPAGNLQVVVTQASNTTPGFALGSVVTAATTLTAVRASTYNEQSSNAQRSMASSNAADTSAGTGARQVKLTYYDSTGAGPFTETVTLNGTSNVNTVSTTICFVEKMEVVAVGSGGVPAGTLTLFQSTGGGGGTLGTIVAGDNQTFWSHHYVATGKSCFITGISGNNTNASNGSVLSARQRGIPVANNPERIVSDFVRVGGGAPHVTRTYGTPLEVVGPARILLYSACEGSPSITTRASFDYYDK